MSNFEKLAASPEALGAFLESLTVVNSPWATEFQRTFCAECKRPDCDGTPCIHKDKRDNPLWWLAQKPKRERRQRNDYRNQGGFPPWNGGKSITPWIPR